MGYTENIVAGWGLRVGRTGGRMAVGAVMVGERKGYGAEGVYIRRGVGRRGVGSTGAEPEGDGEEERVEQSLSFPSSMIREDSICYSVAACTRGGYASTMLAERQKRIMQHKPAHNPNASGKQLPWANTSPSAPDLETPTPAKEHNHPSKRHICGVSTTPLILHPNPSTRTPGYARGK